MPLKIKEREEANPYGQNESRKREVRNIQEYVAIKWVCK